MNGHARTFILIFLTLATGSVPANTVTLKAHPLGRPDAPTGGTLYRVLDAEPETFNPLNSTSVYAGPPAGYATESLFSINPDTYDFEPQLANGYEVSNDALTYTIRVNPKAHFWDGTPVTAEDVQFSLTYMKDPAFGAAVKVPFYESIASVTVKDPRAVVVKMKQRYYQNLEIIGGATIFPKHVYGDPKRRFPDHPVYGSGPYKVTKYTRGQRLTMERDPNWWAKDDPAWKGWNKFDRISFRFVNDEGLRFEMIKRGQIDYMDNIGAEAFETRAVGEPFGTKVRKMKIEDGIGGAWNFVAWNYRDPEDLKKPHPIFADVDVRHAMALLLNRKLMIDKFKYGMEVEGRGPALTRSPMLPPDLAPVPFDPAAARALLKKAGWEDRDKDGILEKTIDGKKVDFRVSLLLANRNSEKYYTIYKEDLRQSGIALDIKLIEWSTLVKLLGEKKFDGITLGWIGGGRESDLKQIWHTESARDGGSNFISYSNPKVDRYIDEARGEMDVPKRMKLWQKATALIAADHAYTYMFNPRYDLFMLNSRIGYDKPRYTFGTAINQFWVANP